MMQVHCTADLQDVSNCQNKQLREEQFMHTCLAAHDSTAWHCRLT